MCYIHSELRIRIAVFDGEMVLGESHSFERGVTTQQGARSNGIIGKHRSPNYRRKAPRTFINAQRRRNNQ